MRRDPDLTRVFVAFGRGLRARGLDVGAGQLARYCAALSVLDPTDLTDVYWAGRACLLSQADDTATYDSEFASFFLGVRSVESEVGLDAPGPSPSPDGRTPGGGDEVARASDPDGQDADEHDAGDRVGAVASLAEVLRHRSFAAWTEDELARLPEVLRVIEVRLPVRRTRRWKRSGDGVRLDLRRTVQRSLRHEGELLDRAWRRRRPRPRRVVVLIDVSGSMSTHTRALLQFSSVLVRSRLGVEVFCFGTRLTRVTEALSHRDPDRALAGATEAIVDAAGGTRIGESLGVLLRRWGSGGRLRGAVVLLFSDGLERGDPETLGLQMARLARLAHAVVWLNPLKGDPSYQPLTRGMRAALPHLDRLVAADTLDDLVQLARTLPTLV